MSSPNTMMKGKISNSTAEETAGNLASSLTRSELTAAFCLLSKMSYGEKDSRNEKDDESTWKDTWTVSNLISDSFISIANSSL